MSVLFAPFRHAGIRVLLSALILLVSLDGARAANPSDWWVHIANDRASHVKKMLDEGADPNEISPQGQPAIMQAIREDAWEVYDVLLNHPDTVLNAINTHRETPLMYLAVVGETERARDLIRRGALVNRKGWTPLHYAASTGKLETAKMLLDHGADVNAPAPDDTTPLMMAAYAGSEPMVRLLLEHGADVMRRTNQDYDVVDWANFKSHTTLAGKLQDLIAAMNAPDTTAEEGKAEQASAISGTKGTGNTTGAGSGSSTSRYFDLDRFDDPAYNATP